MHVFLVAATSNAGCWEKKSLGKSWRKPVQRPVRHRQATHPTLAAKSGEHWNPELPTKNLLRYESLYITNVLFLYVSFGGDGGSI